MAIRTDLKEVPDYNENDLVRTKDGLSHRFVRWDYVGSIKVVVRTVADNKVRVYSLSDLRL